MAVSLFLIKELRYFEFFILLSIAINSIGLAAYDYLDRPESKKRNTILNTMGDVFTIIFLIESVLKIFAMGFIVHKKAYLREG